MMTLFFLHDGSVTISREPRRTRSQDRHTWYEALRVVEVHDDGRIEIVKDRHGTPRVLVDALPLRSKVTA